MTCSGNGSSPAYRAATVEAGSSSWVATGPQKPWVRLACGSLSTSRTLRPALARVPARWWQVDVLPTPPFWFNAVMTGMVPPWSRSGSRGVAPLPREARCTVHRYRLPGPQAAGETRRDTRCIAPGGVGGSDLILDLIPNPEGPL